MDLSTSLIIAVAFIGVALGVKFIGLVRERKRLDRGLKAIGLSKSLDKGLLSTRLSSNVFSSLNELKPKAPFYEGVWQEKRVTVCAAAERDGDGFDHAAVVLLLEVDRVLPTSIIGSKSFRSLAKIPVIKLELVDFPSFPNFKSKFVVRSESPDEIQSLFSNEVIRVIEGLKNTAIEFRNNSILFTFFNRDLSLEQIGALIHDSIKLAETLELSSKWREQKR